uniref:MATH domain-containing protein n=1 Tax=Strongyloides papillosus TaxID=174720 RepID=A0A0N5BUG7_STREA
MCNDVVMNKPSSQVIAFLPQGNNHDNASTFKLNLFDKNTKLYSGHRLHFVNDRDFSNKTWDIERSIGYAINYEPKCKVPNLNATLSLVINDVVQECDTKIDQKFGRKETYTFASTETINA